MVFHKKHQTPYREEPEKWEAYLHQTIHLNIYKLTFIEKFTQLEVLYIS